MEQHAIFLDMDNTLIYQGKLIEENVRAIQAAQAAGHKVLINTGRSYGFMPMDILQALPLDGIVAGGGAYIRASDHPILRDCRPEAADEDVGGNAEDKILLNAVIPDEIMRELCDWFTTHPFSIYFEGVRSCYSIHAERPNFTTISRYEDLHGQTSKITIFSTPPQELPPDGMAIIDRYFTYIRHPRYAEGMMKGYSKASGMDVYLQYAGIPLSRSIAMGDSANDLEMLQHAGTAAAMGDSTPEILDCADFISCSCADGGVAKALYTLLDL